MNAVGPAGFGDHVRRLRRARGLTQERLAERCGLSPDTIRRLEGDDFSPSLGTLHKLVGGLHMRLTTLFAGYELVELDTIRELMDLLATRSPEEIASVVRVVRVLLDQLDVERARLGASERHASSRSSVLTSECTGASSAADALGT